MGRKINFLVLLFLVLICLFSGSSYEPLGPDDVIDAGDTAWMLVSSAFVLLMTPGLAFFYGGMVTASIISTMLRVSSL